MARTAMGNTDKASTGKTNTGKTSTTRTRATFARVLSRIAGLALVLGSAVHADTSRNDNVDFSEDYERIFQIRVVSKDAGGKSSIGSGFQVSKDGLILTNYHVVSELVMSPEHYDLEFEQHDGGSGKLVLLDFDIISDLALLRHPDPTPDHFDLAERSPKKGEIAYALGNPGDWGMVMVPGPTNGFVEHRYDEQILFSGSLNGGMSGGPSLNGAGEVIGVNVATAGSQLSFLVPVENAKRLVASNRELSSASYDIEIRNQIAAWQRPRVQQLIDGPWATEEFLGKPLFGEIRRDFQCWGDTNDTDEERSIEFVRKSCSAGDQVYIGSDFNAGQIIFFFESRKPVKLNRMQFARSQSMDMSSDNFSSFENSTDYVCETDFVTGAETEYGSYNRVMTCIRAFRKLPGLYDSLLMVMKNSGDHVFRSHLSLSGLEKGQIQAMNRRFVERSL